MNAEQLRGSILQYAMQGKLVPQHPNEEPVEKLLERIKDEKARLIKEKLMKTGKPLPPITKEEIPFEVPDSWKWVRFGDPFNVVSARRVKQSDWRSSGIPFYRAREIGKLAEFGYVDNELFIDEELFNAFSKSGLPKPGDLMLTAVGTLGKCYIVDDQDKFYYKDASVICLENISNLNSQFVKYFIESSIMKDQIKKNSSGTTVSTLTIVRMNQYIFPLPPLEEQKRIVQKIEELFKKVDEYSSSHTNLEELQHSFPYRLEKSILHFAIQGKSVRQDPNDEPAEKLLQRIKEEKDRLVKEKVIKKEKPLPPIVEEEIPFELPETWEWVRLAQIGYITSGGTPKTSEPEYWDNGAITWITPSDMGKNKTKFLSESSRKITLSGLENSSAQLIPKNSIVYSSRAPIGHINIVTCDYTTNQGCKSLTPLIVDVNYLYFALKSMTPYIEKQASGTTFKEISGTAFSKSLIPLPPLEEQKRIVRAIEEALNIAEQLKV